MVKPPYYPIVYVRGYAGSQGAIEETVATPYMGFNLGSTKYRQTYTGKIEPYIFESPLIRLMKDYGYKDAYHDGQLIPFGPVAPKSIWIFRYYDIASKDLGKGEKQEIEFYAEKLRDFIIHIQKAVGMENDNNFKVYLIAHSMGGLICRCYLQNKKKDLHIHKNVASDWEKKGVDKLFTYATPHGGIDLRNGLGWLEGMRDFFDINNSASFGPKRMKEILDVDSEEKLYSMEGRFPAERVFCLIGTDSKDYNLARKAVGPQSDGLVMIKNAYVKNSSRAYVSRSHSGHYGIVNSESGYQNLERFLFGDTCVKVALEDMTVNLPQDTGYYIEKIVSIRGLPVVMNRRTVDSFSATFRDHKKLTSEKTYLFTTFLSKKRKVSKARSLGYQIHFRIVPQYPESNFFFKKYHVGQAVFDDQLIVEVVPQANGEYKIKYGWGSLTLKPNKFVPLVSSDGVITFKVPFERKKPLRITGTVVFELTSWN